MKTTTTDNDIVNDIIDNYPGPINEATLEELNLAPNVVAKLVSYYPDCTELTMNQVVSLLCNPEVKDEFRVHYAKENIGEISNVEINMLIAFSGRKARGQLTNIGLQYLRIETAFAYIMSSTPDQITEFGDRMADSNYQLNLSQKIAIAAASSDPQRIGVRLQLPATFCELLLR